MHGLIHGGAQPALYIRPMSFRLEHRIGVAAPAAAVWSVLADLPGWSAWNPLYPKAEGELRIGGPLRLELHVPQETPETQQVGIIDWVPDAQLVWAAKYGGGLVRSVRYLEIEVLTEVGCIFSNGEVFSGLGARFVPRRLKARTRQGFVDMGEALKRRVEALHGGGAA